MYYSKIILFILAIAEQENFYVQHVAVRNLRAERNPLPDTADSHDFLEIRELDCRIFPILNNVEGKL